jgi:hypothetical protein
MSSKQNKSVSKRKPKNDRENRDGILNHGPKKKGHGFWGALYEAQKLDIDPPTGVDDPNDPNYRGDED